MSFRAATGVLMAFRRVSAWVARLRVLASLMVVLAALWIMPMPVAPHDLTDSDHVAECHRGGQRNFDYCHNPKFSLGQYIVTLDDTAVLGGYFGGPLPTATDEDHDPQYVSNPTMVYSLGGEFAEVRDEANSPDPQSGDAKLFRVNKFTDGAPRIRTIEGQTYDKPQYRVKLVACDGNYKRGYILLIINNTRTNGNGDNGDNGDNGNGNGGNGNGNGKRQRQWRQWQRQRRQWQWQWQWRQWRRWRRRRK